MAARVVRAAVLAIGNTIAIAVAIHTIAHAITIALICDTTSVRNLVSNAPDRRPPMAVSNMARFSEGPIPLIRAFAFSTGSTVRFSESLTLYIHELMVQSLKRPRATLQTEA